MRNTMPCFAKRIEPRSSGSMVHKSAIRHAFLLVCLLYGSLTLGARAEDTNQKDLTKYGWFTRIEKANSGELRCSGSFIGTRFVLTAADCIGKKKDPSDFRVVIGFPCEEGDNCSYETIKVQEIHRSAKDDGVAILRLKKKVSPKVPFAIPFVPSLNKRQDHLEEKSELTLVGAGNTANVDGARDTVSIQTKVISAKKCIAKTSNVQLHERVNASEWVCSMPTGVHTTCDGDLGAPLIAKGKKRWEGSDVVMAVHLEGPKKCDNQTDTKPLVHIPVRKASKFVSKTVCKDESPPEWCGAEVSSASVDSTPAPSDPPNGPPRPEPEPPMTDPSNAAAATVEPTPTADPTPSPTRRRSPTLTPSDQPTDAPSSAPIESPTRGPTSTPIKDPTPNPTPDPTFEPTKKPTGEPTEEPTKKPTGEPTEEPTRPPTEEPTGKPTPSPSNEPTRHPTNRPTQEPTNQPTLEPTNEPTKEPTNEPSHEPTAQPTQVPTFDPTFGPTNRPTVAPSQAPTQRVTLLHSLEGHSDDVWSLDFHPTEGTLVSSACDNTFKIWDVASGSLLTTKVAHDNCVRSVRYSPDGEQLATGSDDNRVKIWSASSDGSEPDLSILFYDEEWRGGIETVSWRNDGDKVVSACGDETIRVHHVDDGGGTTTLANAHPRRVRAADYSSDDSHIATASFREIRIFENSIFETKVFTEPTLLYGLEPHITYLEYSPNGKFLAVSYENTGLIGIWDMRENLVVKLLEGHTSTVREVRWSPDSKHLISGSHDNTARVWNKSTGEGMILLETSSEVDAVAWSPDESSDIVAVGTRDDMVHVLKINSLP